jgi:hypothetical protein
LVQYPGRHAFSVIVHLFVSHYLLILPDVAAPRAQGFLDFVNSFDNAFCVFGSGSLLFEEPDDVRPFWHILRMSSRRTSFSWCVYVLSMCSVKRDDEGIFGIALAAGLELRYLVLRGAANDTRVVLFIATRFFNSRL